MYGPEPMAYRYAVAGVSLVLLTSCVGENTFSVKGEIVTSPGLSVSDCTITQVEECTTLARGVQAAVWILRRADLVLGRDAALP